MLWTPAEVAELADALDSKSNSRKRVRVRVPPSVSRILRAQIKLAGLVVVVLVTKMPRSSFAFDNFELFRPLLKGGRRGSRIKPSVNSCWFDVRLSANTNRSSGQRLIKSNCHASHR